MSKKQQPLTTNELAVMTCTCGDPGCDGLYLTQACHPGAGLRVKYDKDRETLVMDCGECHKFVSEVLVATKEESEKNNSGLWQTPELAAKESDKKANNALQDKLHQLILDMIDWVDLPEYKDLPLGNRSIQYWSLLAVQRYGVDSAAVKLVKMLMTASLDGPTSKVYFSEVIMERLLKEAHEVGVELGEPDSGKQLTAEDMSFEDLQARIKYEIPFDYSVTNDQFVDYLMENPDIPGQLFAGRWLKHAKTSFGKESKAYKFMATVVQQAPKGEREVIELTNREMLRLLQQLHEEGEADAKQQRSNDVNS